MGRTDIERVSPVITKPFLLSRSVYNALGPIEKLAALALEKVGDVRIVDCAEPGGGPVGPASAALQQRAL